jgi:hypothetical protein
MHNYDHEAQTYCIAVYKGCTIHADSEGYYWREGFNNRSGYFGSKAGCIAEIEKKFGERK